MSSIKWMESQVPTTSAREGTTLVSMLTGTPNSPMIPIAHAAPMAGGPFVASPGEMNLTDAEPRAKDESWNEANPQPGQEGLRRLRRGPVALHQQVPQQRAVAAPGVLTIAAHRQCIEP